MPTVTWPALCACLLALAAGAAAAVQPLLAFGVLLAGLALIQAASHPATVSPLLLVLAAPFVRPNYFGESLSVVGAGLVVLAALLALAADKGQLRLAMRSAGPLRSAVLWLSLVYVLLLIRSVLVDEVRNPTPLITGLVLTSGVVAAAAVVLADASRRRWAARAFVILIAAMCTSYVLSLLCWAVFGLRSGQITSFQVWDTGTPQPVYAPFTTTVAELTVLGIPLPRFSGLGREPGLMAMYIGFAVFLAARLGWTHLRLRLVLVAGLLGTLSTAGFGVLLVVLAYDVFLRARGERSQLHNRCVQALGVLALGASVWLAVFAPVFGLSAKADMNTMSLTERSTVTSAGLRELASLSLVGGNSAGANAAISLVAAIAPLGLLFSLLVTAVLWMPMRTHTQRDLAVAPVAVLFLTLLTAQPSLDSTWVYVLVLLAYGVTQRDSEPGDDGSPVPAMRQTARSLVPAR